MPNNKKGQLGLDIQTKLRLYVDQYGIEEMFKMLASGMVDEIATATHDGHETKNYLRYQIPQGNTITGSIYLGKEIVSAMTTGSILVVIEGTPKKHLKK